jgi:UDP-N-acetylmuramyl pentapeptide phosphotransferase/UDP-N-acetylglucosamine-1-phosphate transferase
VLEALLFIAGAAIAWVLVLGLRRWAGRLRLIDLPNERSMHTRPTPRGGGAAIVTVCILGLTAVAAFGLQPDWPQVIGYVVGASVIVCISLLDDVFVLPAGVRLAAQLVGAAFMVAGLLSHPGVFMSLTHQVPAWLLVGIAIVWSVGLTNVYNFMDGIDGLAATQGLIAGLGWSVLASLSGQSWLAVLSLLIAAGCLGFVFHNWYRARVFMGDVGSAFLGFTFAYLALAAPRRTDQIGAGVLILWPFIFDASLTIIRRLRRRENILVAHRSHLYQRLVLAGWGHAAVASLYASFALLTLGLASVWWLSTSGAIRLVVIAVVGAASAGLWSLVIRSERSPGHSSPATV